jgi:hypothetical protein
MSTVEKIKRKFERKTINFSGTIISSRDDLDTNGTKFVRLSIINNEGEKMELIAFHRKVGEKIWQTIANNDCIDKKYIFSCEKVTTVIHLANWKEAN